MRKGASKTESYRQEKAQKMKLRKTWKYHVLVQLHYAMDVS